jgi:hypothetical protein
VFCREQIAQLRDYHPAICQAGADLYVIGPGTPAQAGKAMERFGVPYEILADPDREAFLAADMRRDLLSNLNLRTFGHLWRTIRKGIPQGALQGNPFQQGGALVIASDRRVLYHYIGMTAGDHPDPDDMLAALTRNA